MKKTIILYLVFLLASSTAFAQQNVVTLSDTLYDTSKVVFSGQSLDGWLFKLGNDNSWSAQELDVTNWQALKPEELKPELADENGRLEGWFRIKIKFDAEFNPIPTAIKSGVFGASTVFINGKNIHSFGKTGNDASDFIENKAYQSDIMPFQFEKDSIYTIAIHYVDYVTHFPIKKLKSNGQDANDIILFVTSNYKEKRITDYYNIYLRVGILTAIPFSFAILFWLIFLLNPFEKNIRNFAVALTLFSIIPIFLMLSTLAGNSYTQYKLFSIINNTSAVIFVCYVPILLGSVFERHIHKILIAILVLICFGNILLTFTTSYPDHLIFLFIIIPLLISLYYLLSSLGKLNGAQWVIAISYLSTLSSIILLSIMTQRSNLGFALRVIAYTSAPFSFMIYTAIRFKEMIVETRLNAEKITQLSEEKRMIAENQKGILEIEVKKQTEEIRNSLTNLKETQKQLIQSEKMASLGELTAGIAHEIQNPLNFVNNFSELSNELIDEMNDELDKGDVCEAKAISSDIKQNLEKITHHGKRADAIVKGMLAHSRSGKGEKEPTDLNALAEEYLKLSYHGLRAKDKSFNADFKTDFDPNLPKVNVVPQDIGRVLLNLINNAFQAVNERNKKGESRYNPEVSVKTQLKTNNQILITISDNGPGIPDSIKEKIFQPFFTTKPTGQGTGLGLSLSYDIVKAHGGELEVGLSENERTAFTLTLPTK